MVRSLWNFVIESNLIEGIDRRPTHEEIVAHANLEFAPYRQTIAVSDLVAFVSQWYTLQTQRKRW